MLIKNLFPNKTFKTPSRTIFANSDISRIVEDLFEIILAKEDVYQDKGSGFPKKLLMGCHWVFVNKYQWIDYYIYLYHLISKIKKQ
jgi:hypothetical protein